MSEFTMRVTEEEDSKVFGPTLKVKLIMKTVPVFDETELYDIRFSGAIYFPFNSDKCNRWIRI